MKKLFIPLLLLCLSFNTKAQQITRITSIAVNGHKVDETSVVKDSLGNVYTYQLWMQFYQTGRFVLRPATPGSDTTNYILMHRPAIKTTARYAMPRPRESEYFITGQAIKPFKIRDIYDNKLDAKGWAGKTIVLNYWFIGCAPCRQEIPELNKIAAKYADNPNVIFIGIALDQAFEIRNFIRKNPFGYVLVPDGREYAEMFKIKMYPTNVVIDKTGKVIFHASGYSPVTATWIDKSIAQSEEGIPAQ